ncbi:exodeoxyribonuclease V subunit beta [Umboniibacter marinipuniceus]|uniref:RecBCD enzyme subunit RecB n=1 Tax=Umboniibacter marinipuniceus TaxID=569599 RepID=A0A3M0A1N9_9GAMM|nr:exodeoxyribonuclease V subunit beta [Umboniibacter marinipuniceus]RMA78893.1 DNA helicase/exodeoxyribonuclease V beta subunit [Umboniibacter marinipuniceus]
MKTLDANTLPLTGVQIIEASAGTGKTFTIASLYVRLILGLNAKTYTPADITVVTFTKAATAELRDRIRARLHEERQELSRQVRAQLDGEAFDASLLYQQLIAKHGTPTALTWAPVVELALAEKRMDGAEIHTIHSFCLRLLKQYAFDSKLPFGLDITMDDDTRRQAVNDFWRQLCYRRSERDVLAIQQQFSHPDELLSALNGIGVARWEEFDCAHDSFDELLTKLNAIQAELTELWTQYSHQLFAEIESAMREARLSRTVWKIEKFSGQAAKATQCGSGEAPFYAVSASQLKVLRMFSTRSLAKSTLKNKAPVPANPLSDFLDQLPKDMDLSIPLLRDAYFACIELEEQIERRHGTMRSDNILTHCAKFISDAPEAVIANIRSQIKIAMIDEFQDTDPQQFSVFKRLFNDSESERGLMLIGDPKQAIYRFRGADLNVYLQARDEFAGENCQYTMDKNWRSSQGVIDAIAALFNQSNAPFINSRIGFPPVSAAKTNIPTVNLNGQTLASLEWQHHDLGEKPIKAICLRATAQAAARRIAEFLSSENGASLDGDSIQARDIAVLVDDKNQASVMQKALADLGISTNAALKKSVFASPEAAAYHSLLLCMLEPNNERLIRRFIADPCLGYSAVELQRHFDDENNWQLWTSTLTQALALWHQRGPLAAIEHVGHEWGLYARLLRDNQANRRLSNWLQLGELLQNYAAKSGGIAGQVEWFQFSRTELKSTELNEIQLESDDNVVTISTIHKSKGLQYAAVFIPFAWAPKIPSTKQSIAVVQTDQQRLISLRTRVSAMLTKEYKEESIRLLYVALTRAINYIYIGTCEFKDANKSAIAHLSGVLSSDNVQQAITSAFPRSSIHALPTLMQEFELEKTNPNSSQTKVELKARTFSSTIDVTRGISSYSALAKALKHGPAATTPADSHISAKDIDDHLRNEPSRFDLAKGAHVGNFLHDALETLNWDALETGEHDAELAELMLRYGVPGFDDLALIVRYREWLSEVINTPFLDTRCLKDVSEQDRLAEMEFFLPLNETLTPEYLNPIVAEHLDMPLQFAPVSGHLKGFIDLILRLDGKYYVADYKSNFLGDSFADYHRDGLHNAVRKSGYTLQYLIYVVALHRHLRHHLADYQYDTHFGGVYYLYLRGMHPEQGTSGIYFDRPPLDLVNQLDTLFAQEPR